MDYRALEDKSSPYYYGEDATYKAPASSRKSSQKIQYELDENGLPFQSREESTAERTARRQRVGLPVGERPSGNVVRVGGKEYAEGDPALDKILEANRKKQPRMADIRGGGGLDTYKAPPEYLEDDDSVTPLNSNPSRPPRTVGEFGDFMKTLTAKYGIKFPGEQERNGYQSIYLPGTRSAGEDESAQDAKTMGMAPQQAIDRVNGGSTEIIIGGNLGAQTGTSSAPDKGDQSRVVKGFNGHEFGGEHEAPPTLNLDARRRAFLDYDGGKDGKGNNSMMALRAAEAAQGTIKQNGELYAVGDDGKASVRISADGERALKKDGNQMASQDFLKNYRYVPSSPAETESADSRQPVMPSADADTGKFTRGLESNEIEDPSETFRALGLNVMR